MLPTSASRSRQPFLCARARAGTAMHSASAIPHCRRFARRALARLSSASRSRTWIPGEFPFFSHPLRGVLWRSSVLRVIFRRGLSRTAMFHRTNNRLAALVDVLVANQPLLDSRQSLHLRRFLRLLSTEITSLHRRYAASSVLPASRHLIPPGLALTSCRLIATAITAEASRVSSGPLCLHAVTTTRAVTDGIDSLVPFHRLRPSPTNGRVGSCISCFGACSMLLRVRPA
jgi:hypothetical protein